MLIAEDLLLLLTDDRTGRLVVASKLADIALGGAVLVELALTDRVGVVDGRLRVTDGSPTSDELLDEALATVDEKEGKKPKAAVRALGKGLRKRLYERLAARGVLHEQRRKVLGLVPEHRWRSADPSHEAEVRAALAGALGTGATDDDRTAALVALLHALRVVTKVVDPAVVGTSKKRLRANAKAIAEGDWGADAVREAIVELIAAVVAATASSSVVASGA